MLWSRRMALHFKMAWIHTEYLGQGATLGRLFMPGPVARASNKHGSIVLNWVHQEPELLGRIEVSRFDHSADSRPIDRLAASSTERARCPA
jgi:hypothetical protein